MGGWDGRGMEGLRTGNVWLFLFLFFFLGIEWCRLHGCLRWFSHCLWGVGAGEDKGFGGQGRVGRAGKGFGCQMFPCITTESFTIEHLPNCWYSFFFFLSSDHLQKLLCLVLNFFSLSSFWFWTPNCHASLHITASRSFICVPFTSVAVCFPYEGKYTQRLKTFLHCVGIKFFYCKPKSHYIRSSILWEGQVIWHHFHICLVIPEHVHHIIK